jgi:hypothetical protein
MKYRFIVIAQENGELFSKKPIYKIRNIKTNALLGQVFWYSPWRCYCFTQSESGVVFNDGCLKDVVDFIENHAGKL